MLEAGSLNMHHVFVNNKDAFDFLINYTLIDKTFFKVRVYPEMLDVVSSSMIRSCRSIEGLRWIK